MNRDTKQIRRLLVPLGVAALSLALVATVSAAVTVYSNKLQNRAQYRQIDRVGGGKRACDASYRAKAKTMRVQVSGKHHCQFAPPVQGDSPQPDHDVIVDARLQKRTRKAVRKAAYVSVAVRLGAGESYELQVRPKGRRFALVRTPDGAGFPVTGRSSEIRRVGKKNKLRIRARGSTIAGYVNGRRVARATDPDAADFKGAKVAFGLGSSRNAQRGPIATFDNIRVRLPNP